jgi:hypothetical protein
VRPEAARVHHALGDPLVVEVEELLAEVEVLERRRAALAYAEGVLVVADRRPLLRGEHLVLSPCPLVQLSARAVRRLLLAALSRHDLSWVDSNPVHGGAIAWRCNRCATGIPSEERGRFYKA